MDLRLFAYFHDICDRLTYCLVSSDRFAYTMVELIIMPLELINPVRKTKGGLFSFPPKYKAKIFVVITLKD